MFDAVTFVAIVALAVAFGFGYSAGSIYNADLIHMCESKGYYNIDQVRIKCSVEAKSD